MKLLSRLLLLVLLVAQYATAFEHLFTEVMPVLMKSIKLQGDILNGISHAHTVLLSQMTDSLIVRKCGMKMAGEASTLASAAVAAGEARFGQASWMRLDAWLRADGNRRNPGAIADLIAAGLFGLLVTGQLIEREPVG